VSFPFDGLYAVILQGWKAPEGVSVCAEEPFGERRRAEALERFDSVQLIPHTEYDLIPESRSVRTLIHTPDAATFQGVVHRLEAKPAAFKALGLAEPG
jgi:hypothetical protein